MDPRISPIKPHQGFRQIQRQSQRRYVPKANGQPARYIPPPELRQPIYYQNGTTDSPFTYSRRFEDLSASVKQQQKEREFSFSHIDNSYQVCLGYLFCRNILFLLFFTYYFST